MDGDLEQYATSIENLYVMPAGATVPNPAEVLSSQRMRGLITHTLRESFDYVIIDTPPVLAVTDALALAAAGDGVLLVCSAKETHWSSFDRSVEAIQEVEGKMLGVLINRFDQKAAYGSYGYGYGYGYYEYYGEDPITGQER